MKQLMGIVNLTDNSFFEPSRIDPSDPETVLLRIRKLRDEGAGMIDIGACSTAPGNAQVDEECEWRRLEEPLRAIFREMPECRLSIDSFRPEIIRRSVEIRKSVMKDALAQGRAGKLYVNDVKAAEMDDGMLSLVSREGLGYIAMDSSDNPMAFFDKFAACADRYGISDWILDPGFGFGKSIEQNWEILGHLGGFKRFSRPILVALSHKRMIWMPLGLSPDTCSEQSVEAEKLAFSLGADIVRTHDVAAHK